MRTAFSCAGAAILIAASAWAQVAPTPRVIRLDALTCGELVSLPSDQRDRLLIYLNGYLDGTRRASTWDERLTGERIDRAIAECKLRPEAPLLRIFGDAWAR
jgi:HdeA/HdeB family